MRPVGGGIVRAFHSEYGSQRVTRLHIERPAEAGRRFTRVTSDAPPPPQGWCGTPAWDTTGSRVAWLDELPETPPDDLWWCPICVGRAADHLGVLDSLAQLVTGQGNPGGSTVAVAVVDSPKMLRETLCIAQSRIGDSPLDGDRKKEHVDRLQRLIDECDRHRPLGRDGKHGDRHTATCGCPDNPRRTNG